MLCSTTTYFIIRDFQLFTPSLQNNYITEYFFEAAYFLVEFDFLVHFLFQLFFFFSSSNSKSCYTCHYKHVIYVGFSMVISELLSVNKLLCSVIELFYIWRHPIRVRGGGRASAKRPPTSFSLVTSTNIGISPQTF